MFMQSKFNQIGLMKTNKEVAQDKLNKIEGPLLTGTKLKWRNKVAYIMECIDTDIRHRRYIIDSGGWRWSIAESELHD